ncbi:endonuclease/exonuclease/phosphatase family protein [Roseiconus sp. JC912]
MHRLITVLLFIWSITDQPVGAIEPIQLSKPIQLTVLSYNIHHCEGVDGKLDLQRIANVIANVRPDLVALQEVDNKTTRTLDVDQANEIALMTRMQFVFGANIELQGGSYGNAVLSKLPIKGHRNELLQSVGAGEQRGVLVGEIELPESRGTLRLFATHFDHRRDGTERRQSATAINKMVLTDQSPAILMGDLNDVLGSDTLQRLHHVWKPTVDRPLPTIPVVNPKRQIDFVLAYPPPRWRVIETRVIEETLASDHRPIVCKLQLLPD